MGKEERDLPLDSSCRSRLLDEIIPLLRCIELSTIPFLGALWTQINAVFNDAIGMTLCFGITPCEESRPVFGSSSHATAFPKRRGFSCIRLTALRICLQ